MPGTAPPVADERDGLLTYLGQQRYLLRLTVHGLTEEQARSTPTVSPLSVGGLIRHAASTERGWMDTVLQRGAPSGDDYEANFHMGDDQSVDDVLADYAACAAETEAIIAGIADLGQAVPVPEGVPWFPDDVDNWSVRWVLLHLIEETAHHAGHADIVRESIDGATTYQLMAQAEGGW